MPGVGLSLQSFAADLFLANPHLFYTVWWFGSLLLIIMLLLLLIASVALQDCHRIPVWAVVGIGMLAMIFCRFPSLFYGESSTDESQWLASVITIMADPVFYFKEFYLYDIGRSLTIIPLWFVAELGFSVDYGLAKLTGILCWLTFYFFYYLLIRDLLGKKTAVISSTVLCGYLATFSAYGQIAYNSETPTLVFLISFLFFFYKSIQIKNKMWPFLAGFFLAASFFAKLQSLYILMASGIFSSFFYLSKNHKKNLLIFVVGGVFCVILFAFPYALYPDELLHVFYEVLNHTQNGILDNNFSLVDKIKIIYLNPRDSYQLVSILLMAFSLISSKSRKFIFCLFCERRIMMLLFAIFYAASSYTVLSPQDYFMHYGLYMVLPSALIMAVSINAIISTHGKLISLLLVSVAFLVVVRVGMHRSGYEFHANVRELPRYQTPFGKIISKYAEPGYRMIILGWDSGLHIETGLLRGSRYWYAAFLNRGYPEEYKMKVLERYYRDIEEYRPEIIVELSGRSNVIPSFVFQLDDFPELKIFIQKRYDLVFQSNKRKVFLLKRADH